MTEATEYGSGEESRKYIASLREKLERAAREKFTVLLIGRTGMGKSSTINSLMGKEIAKVGDWAPTTASVNTYEGEAFGIRFTVVDTPGLCDALEEEGNDDKYLKMINDKRIKADCVFFVTRLDETRITGDEKRGLKLITTAFGQNIWNNAVIVFTFANTPRKGITYREVVTTRHRLIRNEIGKYASEAIAAKIPAVAVDNESELTPDGNLWLPELYTTALERMSEEGSLPFFLATIERIVTPAYSGGSYSSSASSYQAPIKLNDSQADRISSRFDTLAHVGKWTAAGAAVGAVAGPVGAAVGAAVGAVIGFFTRKR